MPKHFSFCALLLIASLFIAIAFASAAVRRQELDDLWEQHMLDGTFITIYLEDSGNRSKEEHPPQSLDPKNDEPTFSVLMTHPIVIQKLGDGFFGNGGWHLNGGLLRRVRDGSATFEVYGKKVDHRPSYFPFIHRDPPEDVGYEFFLLQRTQGSKIGKVLRKWTFTPETVIRKNPDYASVKINFQYDKSTHTAMIKFLGLKKPVEERVDLTEEVQSPQ